MDDELPPETLTSELQTLRQSLILRLTRAMNAAALNVQQLEEGIEPTQEGKRRNSLDLLRMLPVVLPLIEPPPVAYPSYPIPQIPVCPLCGKGPGAHWPDDCPQKSQAAQTAELTPNL